MSAQLDWLRAGPKTRRKPAQPAEDWQSIADPHARARRSDPTPSHEAAEHVEATGKAAVQRGYALAAVRAFPGCTSMELAEKAAIDRYTLARRLPELREEQLVRNGPTPRGCSVTGRSAMTWWPA